MSTRINPSNKDLTTLFTDVNKIVIKAGGVYNGKAMYDHILVTITQADHIHTFHQLLEVNEDLPQYYCMCSGTYAIELHHDTSLTTTIGFHHGISIRYDHWNSDARLTKRDDFLHFLAAQGLAQPLADRLEEIRNQEPDRIAERKWLEISPSSFRKYWSKIKAGDKHDLPALISQLNIEIPDRHQQIIKLLQVFGAADNYWSPYPDYEEIPNDILKTFAITEIIEAYIQSNRNYKTRKGLGRFLCQPGMTGHIAYITQEVIDDLQKCFNWLGDQRGMDEIFSLQNQKKNH